MPELPEVEVIRNGIATCLIAQRVERVIVRTARLRWPIPPQLGLLMTGEIIQDVGRRGKYLYVECSQGYLLIHLGMTGTLRIWPRHAQAVTDRHDHVDWIFEDCLLRFRDPRRLARSYGIRATRAIFCCIRAFPALGSNLYPPPFTACIFISIRVHARSRSSKRYCPGR